MKLKFILPLLLLPLAGYAQTDTTLTLTQCEELFFKNNLTLVAAKFDIEAAKAMVIQARLWDNPNVSLDLNAYDPDAKKYFNIGTSEQKAISVQQIIYLGGKKHREVALARTNVDIAELEFTDLLRNLKLQLRKSYFDVYFDNLAYSALSIQMNHLDTLVHSYNEQVKKGNLPMKDFVRLQALYLNFKDEKSELYRNIIENQNQLVLLTGIANNIVPVPVETELNMYQKTELPSVDSLKRMALSNRTDYKVALKNSEALEWNLKWQKSMAIPDITLGANWNETFQKQVGVTLGMPIPVWNRNQGNIKMAEAKLSQANVQKDYLSATVSNEVVLSYKKWQEARRNYELLTPEAIKNFQDVEAGILKNFHNGNVSLIEFTDFMESYNQTQMQYQRFAKTLINACEEINYSTNSILF